MFILNRRDKMLCFGQYLKRKTDVNGKTMLDLKETWQTALLALQLFTKRNYLLEKIKIFWRKN